MLFSLLIGHFLLKIGRKNSIIFGYFVEILTCVAFGFMAYIEDE